MMDPIRTLRTLSADEAEAASALWWVLLLSGVFSLIIGLFILGHDWTVGSLAGFVGIILIFEGIFSAASPGLGSMRIWSIVVGVLGVLAGIAIIVWPSRGLILVAELIAAYVVIKGTFTLATSIGSRHAVDYWWLGTILGILETAIGIWLMRRPGVTLYVVIILTGVWLVIQGVMQIMLAFEVRNLPHRLRQIEAERGATSLPPSPIAPGP